MPEHTRNELLLTGAADAMILMDVDGRITEADPQSATFFGLSAEEMLGMEFSGLIEDDTFSFDQSLSSITEGDIAPEPLEVRLAAPANERWIVVRLRNFLGAPNVHGIAAFIFEITQRKQQSIAIAQAYAALADLGQRATGDIDPIALMKEATDTVARTLQPDRVAVFEYQPASEDLVMRAGVGWDNVGTLRFPANVETPAGLALISDKPIIVRELATDERFIVASDLHPSLRKSGVTSMASVAIRNQKRTYGVLSLHAMSLREFSATEVDFLSSVAYVVATAFERREVEDESRHSQKLEAIGQLASGVAHEINTPIQFVDNNLRFLEESFDSLMKASKSLHDAADTAPEPFREHLRTLIASNSAEYDIDFLCEEVPTALKQSIDGVQRVSTIVRALKTFGHPDGNAWSEFDLNEALRSTLIVAQNEIKYVADVDARYGEIPRVSGNSGEINQVLLNLIVNAAHAVADVVARTAERGKILVRTWTAGSHVFVAIGDTGGGIPAAVKDRIFDPFFTTKKVGKGTGQGLYLVKTVVEKHSGVVAFESDESGTTFCVQLPLT